MMVLQSVLLLVLLSAGAGLGAPGVVYDQRQTGTGADGSGWNVHVQLEDFLLMYFPSKVGDPASILPYLPTTINLKSNGGANYAGPPPEHATVTIPPEFQGPADNSSQAVQEAIAAAGPEIPETETKKPESEYTTTIKTETKKPEPANTTTIKTETPKPLSTQEPIKRTTQRVVQTTGNDKTTQKTSHDSLGEKHSTTVVAASPDTKTQEVIQNPLPQGIAVFTIKQDSNDETKVQLEESKKLMKKVSPTILTANTKSPSKITQAVIDSVKQKVEAETEAQVRRLYDVYQTPVSQAIALFKIKQEPET